MNEPGIDLTGKLIIKTALGDDIRRILITNEDITYDELVLMMQRVYRGKLSSTDDIVIKYKDEDNDLITIFDSSDLSFAIQCSRILKITLFVNGKPEPMQSDELKMIRSELRHIRDCCTKLLDKLEDRPPGSDAPSSSSAVDSTTHRGQPSKAVTDSPRRATPQPSVAPPISGAGSKEFDPLSTQRSVDDQQKVMSSFGVAASDGTERAGTPDSISSIGSAASSRQQQAGGQAGMYQQQQPQQQGGGQKQNPPWLQQQNNAPSPYSTGTQGFTPVSSTQQPGYAGQPAASQPGAQPPQQPGTHPSPQPGYPPQGAAGPQGAQISQPQMGYSQPGQQAGSQYPGYTQAGGQPGMQVQPGAPSPRFGGPGAPAQQQQPGQQPYPTQQPLGPGQQQTGGYGYQQQQPQPGGSPAPPPSTAGANPYARQGPGYGSGYPRPAGNYPQGYQ